MAKNNKNKWIKEIELSKNNAEKPLSIKNTSSLPEVNKKTTREIKRYYLGNIQSKAIYLTGREMDVASLLLQHLTYKLIGEILGLSARTIEFYIKQLKFKFCCEKIKDLIVHLNEIEIIHKYWDERESRNERS